jgi:pilus assembly protein CpaE
MDGQNQELNSSVADTFVIPALRIDLFFLNEQTKALIDRATRDRRLIRSKSHVYEGGIKAAIDLYQKKSTPNLIVIENNDEPELLFPALDRLAEECLPDTQVIIISNQNDVSLYRQLINRGVTDEVTFPFRPIDLIEAIAAAWKNESNPRIGRLIAFIGARGGAGSSTVGHNVAGAMARSFDTDVLLADLDLQMGTVGIDFDVDGSYGMNDVLKSGARLDEVLLERTVLKYDEKLEILASETNLNSSLELQADAIEKLINLAQTTPRHVILDLPRTWGEETKKALISADQIVITATPDLTSLRNTKQISEYLRQARPNDDMPILVMNQVGQPRRPEIAITEFCEAVRLNEGHSIPYNSSIFGRAANSGRIVTYSNERSSVASAFRDIAEDLLNPGMRNKPVSIKRKLVHFMRKWW